MSEKVQITSDNLIKITTDGRVQLTTDLPDPTLFCDSVSASKSKCGFAGFIDFSTFYLTKTWIHNETSSQGGAPCAECCVECNESISEQSVQNYDHDTCVVSTICSGGHTGTLQDTDCSVTNYRYDFVQPGSDPICYEGCCRHLVDGGGCCDFPTSISDGSTIDSNTYRHTDISINPTELGCDNSGIMETTLSDEYTTEMLVSNTEDDLPDYANNWTCDDQDCNCAQAPDFPCGFFDNGQCCECSASYDLSDDELSLTIQNFQYLFTMDDPPSADSVLRWVERFTPDDPETGLPDPSSATDNEKSFTWDGSQTQTDIFECIHPNSNGETTIEDVHWE